MVLWLGGGNGAGAGETKEREPANRLVEGRRYAGFKFVHGDASNIVKKNIKNIF